MANKNYERSGMGRTAKGSPIPLWGAVIRYGPRIAKGIGALIAGEAAWYGGEKTYDYIDKKSKESAPSHYDTDQTPDELKKASNVT